jgi:hypothetical protein
LVALTIAGAGCCNAGVSARSRAVRAAFEELILPELRAIRADLAEMRRAIQADLAEIRQEVRLARMALRSMRLLPFADREDRCRPRRRSRRTDAC